MTDKEFYTVRELAERIGVSNMTVYNMVKAKQIAAHKFLGSLRFAAADVEAMIERARIEAEDGVAEEAGTEEQS